MAGDLGSLIVSIGTDLKDLDKGLGQAQKNIQGFQQTANKVLGLIGFSLTAAAFVNLGKATIEYGETLHKLALQTGMTASEIAKLKYVAEQSETSVEAVTSSFRFLARAMSQAGQGNAEAINTFAKFHVEFKNADGTLRDYNQVMLEVADRIKNTSNDTVILAEGQKILGRNFMQLIPLLKEGSEGIKKLTDRYSEMQRRVGLTDDQINKFAKDSDTLSDTWKDVGTAFQFMLIEVLTPLIPKMKEFVDLIVKTDWKGVSDEISGLVDEFKRELEVITAIADAFDRATDAGASFLADVVDPFLSDPMNAEDFPTDQAGMFARNQNLLSGENMDQIRKSREGVLSGQPGSFMGAAPMEQREGPMQGSLFGAAGQGIEQQLGVFDKIKEKMTELKAEWGDMSKSIAETWKTGMEMIAQGFGTGVADMIVDGKDFGESMKQMWSDITKMVISEIVKIIAQQIILFGWQVITGTVGSGNIVPGKGKFLGLFRDGGVMPQARDGLVGGAGMRQTGNMGEAGFPVMAHPNEVISPIDKLWGFIESMRPSNINVYPSGRAADDPQLLAQLIQLEGDRQRRRP